MTEADWLACADPAPMFNSLDPGISERKLRLFACGCCRHIWNLLSEKERAIIESVEGWADGLISTKKLISVAGIDPVHGVTNYSLSQMNNSTRSVLEAASPYQTWFRVRNVRAFVVDALRITAGLTERTSEWRRQSDLLRCIFGNPYRPVTVDPSWLAWNNGTVKKIAQAIYDERAFDRLPILADALEESGCTNADIMSHCRGEGPHVRGCWVLDLILNKE